MKRIGKFLAFESNELHLFSPAGMTRDGQWSLAGRELRINSDHIVWYERDTSNRVGFQVTGGRIYRWEIERGYGQPFGSMAPTDPMKELDKHFSGGGHDMTAENLSTLMQMLQRVLVDLDVQQEKI